MRDSCNSDVTPGRGLIIRLSLVLIFSVVVLSSAFAAVVSVAWEHFFHLNSPTSATPDYLGDMEQDETGNTYVTTTSYLETGYYGPHASVLCKYSTDGDLEWYYPYYRTLEDSVRHTSQSLSVFGDSIIYVGMQVDDPWTPGVSTLLCKYDSSGALRWAVDPNSVGAGVFLKAQAIVDIEVDDYGDVYVLVQSAEDDNPTDLSVIITAKFSPDGDLIWHKKCGGVTTLDHRRGYDIAVLTDSICVVAASGGAKGQASTKEMIILAYSTDGDSLWSDTFDGDGGQASDLAKEILINESPFIYALCHSNTVGAYVNKYSLQGDLEWSVIQGGGTDYNYLHMCLLPGDEIALCHSWVLAQMSSDGQFTWADTAYFGTGHFITWNGIASDAAGNVTVTGNLHELGVGNPPNVTSRYDISGEIIWEHRYPIDDNIDNLPLVCVDTSGGTVVSLVVDNDLTARDCLTYKIIELPFVCGDMNGDNTGSDIVDLTYFVDYLFNGGDGPVSNAAADLNGDGNIADIVDLTYLVDFLFGGGEEPICPNL